MGDLVGHVTKGLVTNTPSLLLCLANKAQNLQKPPSTALWKLTMHTIYAVIIRVPTHIIVEVFNFTVLTHCQIESSVKNSISTL